MNAQRFHRLCLPLALLTLISLGSSPSWAKDPSDQLAQQVRSVLSNRCFACHGPDEEGRQGGLRLDELSSMLSAAESGMPPVVPGEPESSELWRRIVSDDDDERMPPADFGQPLAPDEVAAIQTWIKQGAKFSEHWSFVAPQRGPLPEFSNPAQLAGAINDQLLSAWQRNPVDRFVLQRQLNQQLSPSPRATRAELLRRLSLDLIGLPPTIEEVERFEQDTSDHAYESQVDRLLAAPAYGEHWARKWLDLARYADSAGYADDPERTIWPYRDWVIHALNDNMPIDQFTIEQLAGDLLPNPTQEQLVATAFHRNTLTNNEGGTNDEEFRSVAIVDRVNTTMAVWMGVTMACAQCHTHKYDPFTQQEYFKLYAILNQSQDADLRDERPVLSLYTPEQQHQLRQGEQRLAAIEQELGESSPAIISSLAHWEAESTAPQWSVLMPLSFHSQRESSFSFDDQRTIDVRPDGANIVQDTYTLNLRNDSEQTQLVQAIGIRTMPKADLPGGGAGTSGMGQSGGNFVVTGVSAIVVSPDRQVVPQVKFVRVELPGNERILSLAEVQLFAGDTNLAAMGLATIGQATQNSTAFEGEASRAIDGQTSGDYSLNSTTHTATESNPWWELDLTDPRDVSRVVLWNRTGDGLYQRLAGAKLLLLDSERQPLFEKTIDVAPQESLSIATNPDRIVRFKTAHADYQQAGFDAVHVVDSDVSSGWAVAGAVDQSHLLTLIPEAPFELEPNATFKLQIDHNSSHRHHLLGSFRIEWSASQSVAQWSQLSDELLASLAKGASDRSPAEQHALLDFYTRQLAPEHADLRAELAELKLRLSEMKPAASVPIMREVDDKSRRETFVQIRGNYKSLGDKVQPGVPAAFHSLAQPAAAVDRLALARWLVDRRNPLTARVWVNRLWESLFGLGIVRSSEEFGAQGDMPTHPQLLDWLACEFMDTGWNNKQLLKLLVMSETYQQTSRVTLEALEADKDNVWLARGPRVRLSAEMVRDQALSFAGLLSDTMYGPPVRPPQPNLGLNAAFGSTTDWKTSEGEDRYRRGLYTTWRRSNPYPSMATFDAPSREVCTLRRDSTNTPLQALVTLNDPGFVEAAQGLARRVVQMKAGLETDDLARLQTAFRWTTSRSATQAELTALADLLNTARQHFTLDAQAAEQLATVPLGPADDASLHVELAAWTSVCNVLLNLDEVLMKR